MQQGVGDIHDLDLDNDEVACETLGPGGGAQLLGNDTHTESSGYLYIFGEVRNNTGQNLSSIRVVGDIFDTNGTLLDTDTGFGNLDVVTPGDKTCFQIIYFDQPTTWSHYELSTDTFAGGEVTPGLLISDESGRERSIGYETIGIVSNTGAIRAEFVEVVGTLYDATGRVIDCDSTFVKSTDLEPGQASSFELWFVGSDYSDLATYRLQVHGDPEPATVPAPVPLAFLTNHSFYTTTFGTLAILGEVRNSTVDVIRVGSVTSNIFDNSEHLVGVATSFLSYAVLQGGVSTCFSTLLSDAPVEWSSYQFEGKYESGGDIAPNLTLFNVNVNSDSLGFPEIVGQVRNDGGSVAGFVSATATLYNAGGTVVGCEDAYVATTDLNPGQTSSFKIDFFNESAKSYSTFQVQIQGSP